ncbi:hypothetical protein C0J52_08853, partial [Blattella germanica]
KRGAGISEGIVSLSTDASGGQGSPPPITTQTGPDTPGPSTMTAVLGRGCSRDVLYMLIRVEAEEEVVQGTLHDVQLAEEVVVSSVLQVLSEASDSWQAWVLVSKEAEQEVDAEEEH